MKGENNMQELTEYTPSNAWQSDMVKIVQNLCVDDIVKLFGILGLVVVTSIGFICFSGNELSIASGRFEIRKPSPAIIQR